MFENVLNCCNICYDHEIEDEVMIRQTTSDNTGFTTFFLKVIPLIYC